MPGMEERERGHRAMRLVSFAVGLLAAATVAPAVLAGGAASDCEISTDQLRSGATGAGWLAVRAEGPTGSGRVEAECDGGEVALLRLRVAPGERVESRLLASLPKDAVPAFSQADSDLGDLGLELDFAEVTEGHALLTLRAAPASRMAPDSTHRFQLRFDTPGIEPSDAEGLPVEVQIIDAGPLFRDDFGVDPVIGQFSLAP
jgi:hypothetical protein